MYLFICYGMETWFLHKGAFKNFISTKGGGEASVAYVAYAFRVVGGGPKAKYLYICNT